MYMVMRIKILYCIETIFQMQKEKENQFYVNTVDSRYLEFDGTMEKIRVNRSSTQEEL